MDRFKQYIFSIKSEIVILIFAMCFFGTVFLLNSISLDILIYSCSFILFFVGIYWILKYFSFKKNLNTEEELYKLKIKLTNLENAVLKERLETEEYFLLWLHQMKTPITAINLISRDEHKEKEVVLRDIKREIVAIENYSNMVMNYLKLNNPSTDLVLGFVDLNEIINLILKRYSVFFITDKIKLSYEKTKTKVLSDAKWLSVLVEQVLSNSVKYSKGREVVIYFSKNALCIKDTGTGIRKEDLPKIFDKGYSGFNGRLNQKSSGLGLFLVKKIAERLNHRIIVESEVGCGTEVKIIFQQTKK